MLAFCFGISAFSSVLWAFYSLSFMFEKLGARSVGALSLVEFSLYAALIVLPIFLIWAIFGFVMQFLFNKTLNKNLFHLYSQMKKNQDYTDVVARLILESERQAKDGFILGKFDTLVADLNEILSEIIQKTKIASPEQIDALWQKAQNGGKWAFAKVIIEVWQNQSNFLPRILDKASEDIILSGSILEFCARYLSLIGLLEKHDKDKVFLNIVEAGVMGKVFSILAPVDDEIKKRRGFEEIKSIKEEVNAENDKDVEVLQKDGFSIAFEKTFGQEELPKVEEKEEKTWDDLQNFSIKLDNEPTFEISMGNETKIEEVIAKKEDDSQKNPANEDTEQYPFGNWMK